MVTGVELEAAAADSAAGLVGHRKKPFNHKGDPCKNCGTSLEGWFCHACGQNADTHHRSILHLIWEAIEGMFHLDGRLANTLPLLFFKPGKLAKDYMEGRIVRHVPPFRTFLVALLLFIFAAEHAIHGIRHEQELKEEKEAQALMTPAGRKAKADEIRKEATSDRAERLKGAVEERDEGLKEEGADKAKIAAEYADDVKKAEGRYAKEMAEADALQNNPNAGQEALDRLHNRSANAAAQIQGLDFQSPEKLEAGANKLAEAQIAGQHFNVVGPDAKQQAEIKAQVAKQDHASSGKHGSNAEALGGWKEGLAKAVANPDYFLLLMFGWAHRLAVLLLPIMGLSLALVYVNKRQYFIYDHLLVATNLLSFSFLTYAVLFVLPHGLQPAFLAILSFWIPINLFQTLRGGYGSSIFGALIKSFIVWTISTTAFGFLVLGLMVFTLSQM
ncbi:DUF3667 domain-containing protein [Caulobacter sp.]|uniref:DUF3667 domain-containing protein n=1 Tax=Caulobacter sp. TaxID=78 RepID=UPI001B035AB8|nr:DUF3667 domain-containing protein [Caulobacter sp.]MBO9544236.1 DUF3667 domain-containing protein [Caulobacter sp.]